MTTASLPDAALSLGSKIGRYFGVVSVLPSMFLVLWSTALVASDSWRGKPDFRLLGSRMSNWSVSGAAWLLIATLLVALFLHPLQFAMTQLLEGYWGTSHLARLATSIGVRRHRRRTRRLKKTRAVLKRRRIASINSDLQQHFLQTANEDDNPNNWDTEELNDRREAVIASDLGDKLAGTLATEQAITWTLRNYPYPKRTLPTRLGNVLRAAEDKAGTQYGLDALQTVPLLSLVAAERHIQYVDESREQLDTAVRFCTVSLLASILSVTFLINDKLWLLGALIPYALAYVAYRAAVVAAGEYTTAVKTVIDLDRFALYESLRIEQPRDTAEERRVNKSLMDLLGGSRNANVRYRKPPSAKVTGGTP